MEDKIYHFIVTIFILFLLMKMGASLGCAVVVTVIAGATKETLDYYGMGTASIEDELANLMGLLVGVIFALKLAEKKPQKKKEELTRMIVRALLERRQNQVKN